MMKRKNHKEYRQHERKKSQKSNGKREQLWNEHRKQKQQKKTITQAHKRQREQNQPSNVLSFPFGGFIE